MVLSFSKQWRAFMSHPSVQSLTQKLLTWFDQAGRSDLPWRGAPCGARDPYAVWLAEIMLQQTTCAAVIPYFETFMQKWPTVKALASADIQEVMHAWAGLGYYARARNMVKCAQVVAEQRQGQFPRNEEDLLSLPGIGPYTAAAIVAIAHQGPAAPVDGNVIRVLTRLFAIADEMPANKAVVGVRAAQMSPQGRSGDFAEALMDLGATVCRPKNPNCTACPWGADCRAYGDGAAAAYPKKAAKKDKPTRQGWAFWVQRPDGQVLLERRPDKGLLGGMTGFPTTHWAIQPMTADEAIDEAMQSGAFTGTWRTMETTVRHTFTHFHLELGVIAVRLDAMPERSFETLWCAPHLLHTQALPSVMKKVSSVMI